MARFPYYKRNIIALGKLLAEARLNESKRDALQKAPQQALAEIGLPEHVTHLVSFKIVDDTSGTVVALPYRLNQKRIEEGDADYLRGLSSMFQSSGSKTGSVTEEKALN